jgi:aminoglycoside phosphotransferase (APT) family kinase protein
VLLSLTAIPVHDPSSATRDCELPTLAAALDPERAEAELARVLGVACRLTAIRVVRHKRGRRCLVAYELAGFGTVYGKVNRRSYGKSGYRLLAALRASGFDGVADGIAVPEPLGVIGAFRMWLQREAAGCPATEAIGEAGAQQLARRVAAAAHKLHTAGVSTWRRHEAGDELRILRDCLAQVAVTEPQLARRLDRLLDSCSRAAGSLAGAPTCGIHRDFYSDQVLVDGDRLTLVDFDLYCLGDPALDIGNYLGHVTEQALRAHGAATAFEPFERELEESFGRLAGTDVQRRVQVWAALTIARHVYLSTRFPERRHLTVPLLELAEQRLAEVKG